MRPPAVSVRLSASAVYLSAAGVRVPVALASTAVRAVLPAFALLLPAAFVRKASLPRRADGAGGQLKPALPAGKAVCDGFAALPSRTADAHLRGGRL